MDGAVFSPAVLGEAANSAERLQRLMAGLIIKGTTFYIDDGGEILREYANRTKVCDRAKTLIKFLTLCDDQQRFLKFELIRDKGSFEEFEISLAACSATDRNIITDSALRYSKYGSITTKKDVSIFDTKKLDSVFGFKSSIDYPLLSRLIKGCLETMVMHKSGKKIEDLHNDILTALLRTHADNYGFQVSDQSRAGATENGNIGELDIFILKNSGAPFSVIECLRSSSFGPENVVVPEHLNKLLHHYDKLGFSKNFLVTYCEANNFAKAYAGYKEIIKNINSNRRFSGEYKISSTREEVCHPNLRQMTTVHLREGIEVEVIHYFCDFS